MTISDNELIEEEVLVHASTAGSSQVLIPDLSNKAKMTGNDAVVENRNIHSPALVKDKSHGIPVYSWCRSIVERMLSLLTIIILLPLLILIAIVIRIDSPGNPILRQERVGKGGRIFTLYKFRTMYANNDDSEYRAYIKKYITEDAAYKVANNGEEVYKVVNDPRITIFGAWLRKTNLDELPQLINILKGNMSLIGPRPDVPFAVDMYQDWQRERLNVLPGITGLWQVSKRKNLAFSDMVRLDIEYISRQSLLLDIKIALLTIVTILKGDGS